jgi:putative membrane protein insertion efficiency factor
VSLVIRAAVAALAVYQRLLSPFLPQSCRFAPSCSEYARQALTGHGLLRGSALALVRLLKCHPFHPGGWDPPPSRQSSA